MLAVIALSNVSKSFGRQALLTDASFQLDPGERVGLVLQAALARIGVTLDLVTVDVATVLARVRERDFEGVLLAWSQPLESDPESKWHSRWADAPGSKNLCGFADPEVDAWVEAGQRELDDAERHALWRKLHARLHAEQPYLFLFNAPAHWALAPDVEGFELLPEPPWVDVARWRR